MNSEKTFGELLAYHRSKFGISQEELAELSGVSKIQIARYETNKAKPRRKAIEKLALALGINVEDLGYKSLKKKTFTFTLTGERFKEIEKMANALKVNIEDMYLTVLDVGMSLDNKKLDEEYEVTCKKISPNELFVEVTPKK